MKGLCLRNLGAAVSVNVSDSGEAELQNCKFPIKSVFLTCTVAFRDATAWLVLKAWQTLTLVQVGDANTSLNDDSEGN